MRPLLALLRKAVPLVAIGVALVAAEAWACPTCKEDLANNPQGQSLAAGFYYSILLMMMTPFGIIGTLGFVAYRSIKRAQAVRDAAQPGKPRQS
ncbi:MAG TPA: hypothetical protein VEQ85_01940 [Lacipirellulaceae bacterium]|nr:hypothetical protein [Lacipirellulaceae bacterium]